MSEVWLIGGWAIGRAWWSSVVTELQRQTMAARALELDDFGPDPHWWTDALVNRLTGLREPPLLVAWSMGAMIALDALTRPAAPTVAGLIILAGTLRFCRAPGWPFGQTESAVRALRRAVLRDAPMALRAFYRQVRAPEPNQIDLRPLNVVGSPDRLAAALDLLLELDLRDRRPPTCPTRWIHGDRDEVIPLDAGLESARQLHIPMEVVHDTGHDLPSVFCTKVQNALLYINGNV